MSSQSVSQSVSEEHLQCGTVRASVSLLTFYCEAGCELSNTSQPANQLNKLNRIGKSVSYWALAGAWLVVSVLSRSDKKSELQIIADCERNVGAGLTDWLTDWLWQTTPTTTSHLAWLHQHFHHNTATQHCNTATLQHCNTATLQHCRKRPTLQHWCWTV